MDTKDIEKAYYEIVSWWKKKIITTDAQLAEAFNGHIISFAYNSGNIENPNITYHDTREVFEHDGVSNYTGDLRTLYEIRNAKDANDFFFDAFKNSLALDEDFIKELHKQLTKNTYDTRRWQQGERPGQYKKGDYVTGRNETGAAPEEVPYEMAELLDDISSIDNKDALTAAAFFHAKFENIHPFADGNGRTGRMATNYLLVTHEHPPVVIYKEDREEYFNALEDWDINQNLSTLKNFLKQETIKTWEKQLLKENTSQMLKATYATAELASQKIKGDLESGRNYKEIKAEALKYISGGSIPEKRIKFDAIIHQIKKDLPLAIQKSISSEIEHSR